MGGPGVVQAIWSRTRIFLDLKGAEDEEQPRIAKGPPVRNMHSLRCSNDQQPRSQIPRSVMGIFLMALKGSPACVE